MPVDSLETQFPVIGKTSYMFRLMTLACWLPSLAETCRWFYLCSKVVFRLSTFAFVVVFYCAYILGMGAWGGVVVKVLLY
jgi:hypothetical protein